MIDIHKLRALIKKRLESTGTHQKTVAVDSGVNEATLSRFLNQEYKDLSRANYLALVAWLRKNA